MLRAGVLGLGSMGRNHARVLANLEGVALAATCDPLGTRLEGVRHFTELNDFLAQDLDYVVVATPTSSHVEVALAVAASGRHCLIEKPLAPSVDDCARIEVAFNAVGKRVGVGHIERFNPAVLAAKQRISAGELGEILELSTIRRGPYPGRVGDVGVALDLATHDIDMVLFLLGCSYARITSVSKYVTGRRYEDYISAVGLLSDGIAVNHAVNWISPYKQRQVTVLGTEGIFVVDTLLGDLTLFKNASKEIGWPDVAHFRGVAEGDVIRFALRKQEPLRLEHEAFRDWILGQPSAICTAREGSDVVRVAQALISSGHYGRTVDLDA